MDLSHDSQPAAPVDPMAAAEAQAASILNEAHNTQLSALQEQNAQLQSQVAGLQEQFKISQDALGAAEVQQASASAIAQIKGMRDFISRAASNGYNPAQEFIRANP